MTDCTGGADENTCTGLDGCVWDTTGAGSCKCDTTTSWGTDDACNKCLNGQVPNETNDGCKDNQPAGQGQDCTAGTVDTCGKGDLTGCVWGTTCTCDKDKSWGADNACNECTGGQVPNETDDGCTNPVQIKCPAGTYLSNGKCLLCADGQMSDTDGADECIACSGGTPVSDLERTACQTADDCKKDTNAEVVGSQCKCKSGFVPTTGADSSISCAVCPNNGIVDLWGTDCMTNDECTKIENAEVKDGKCVCKSGWKPTQASFDPATGVPDYGCEEGSSASAGVIAAIVCALLAVLAAAVTAIVVVMKNRKARAAEAREMLSVDNM